MSLLVDPLAALFRHELSKVEPLVLDATEVEVELLPPLARVAITRRFSNTSCSLLEAVLMRGERGFPIVVGILDIVATFFVASAAIVVNIPGS